MRLAKTLTRIIIGGKRKRKGNAKYLIAATAIIYISAMVIGFIPAAGGGGGSSGASAEILASVLESVQSPEQPETTASENRLLTSEVISTQIDFENIITLSAIANAPASEEPAEEPEEIPSDEALEDEESETTYAYINTINVRFRSESNTDSDILRILETYTVVEITGTADDWYKILFDGLNGYILSELVTIGQPPISEEIITASELPIPTQEEPARAAALAAPAPTPPAPPPAPVVPEPTPEPTLSAPLPPFSGEPQAAFINTATVRMRSSNSVNSDVVTNLRQNIAVTVTALEGDWYRVTSGNHAGFIFGDFITFGEAPAPPAPAVETLDWWNGGRALAARGTNAVLTDVATGISFNVRIMSGGNHADTEPVTADDTAALKRARGGVFSWTPRAAILDIGGRSIAVSYNGMPHGGGTISGNNFNGHFCIHFLNSRNHFNNRIAPEHQRQIQIAANSR